MPAVHDHICATVGEQFFDPVAGSDRNDTVRFALTFWFYGEVDVSDRGVVVLQRHIFDFDFQKFTVSLAKRQHTVGRHRVDMYFHNTARFERHHTIPDALEIVCQKPHFKGFRIRFAALQTKQQLGAVAIFQNAVLRKEIQVNILTRCTYRRDLFIFSLIRKSLQHTFHNVDKPGSSGINNTRLFQNGKHIRCLFQCAFRLIKKISEQCFRGNGYFVGDIFRCTAHDGKDRALRRLHDGLVCVLCSSLQCLDQCFVIRLIHILQAVCDPLKYLRQDDTGVASGTKQHPIRNTSGDLRNRIGTGADSVHTADRSKKHIIARIPIRDREHIQVIDCLHMGTQICGTGSNHS